MCNANGRSADSAPPGWSPGGTHHDSSIFLRRSKIAVG
jgi:hypothetical protein